MNRLPCGCVHATRNTPPEYCAEARRLWEEAEAAANTPQPEGLSYLQRLEVYMQHFQRGGPRPGTGDLFEELFDLER